MPVASKHITAEGGDRPHIGAATALEFDHGEAKEHAAPVDPLSIGNVAMPSSTEGRKLKRQRLDTAPTMEGLESYIRQKVPDPDDPDFEAKMVAAFGKDYAVTDGEGKGQANDKASVAATTVGSLRRTVHQMLDMSATAAKDAAPTGADAAAQQKAKEVYGATNVNSTRPMYPHAFCADVPQNLELLTCELVGNDDTNEDWTVPPMTPVFYSKKKGASIHPAVYGNFMHNKQDVNGRFAGIALHDGLTAYNVTKEHPSRRCLAIAVGGVVNLNCDKLLAATFQFGDYVFIEDRGAGSFAGMMGSPNQCVPRYFASETKDPGSYKTLRTFKVTCIGRFVGHISKKHGGIRIVLAPGEWE